MPPVVVRNRAKGRPGALLTEIRVVNFRSARRLAVRPGPVCAFIGEPGAGKSNLLLALRALLDPSFDLSSADVTTGQDALSIEGTLADGRTVSLDDRIGAPPLVHFSTALRGGGLVVGRGRFSVRGGGARADPGGARAGACCPGGPHPRARGLRARDIGRRLRDRGAGAVSRPAGPPVSAPAAPTARRQWQSDLLHHARSGSAQHRCARRGQPRHPRRARRDCGRTSAPDRRRRRVQGHVRVRRGALRALPLAGGDPRRGHDREDHPAVRVPGARTRPRPRADLDRRVRRQGQAAALHRDLSASPGSVRGHPRQRSTPGRRPVGGRDEAERAHPPAGRRRRTVVLEPDFEGVAGFHGKGNKPARAWSHLARARSDDLPEPLVRAVRLALDSVHPRRPAYG